MSKRTSSKSDKGCVGFVADGVMRKATIYAFKTNDKDPSEIISELQQYFGSVKGKYICISDVDEVYDKFLEELKDHRIKETPLFSVSITTGNTALKQVSGTSKSHNIKCDNGEDDAEEKEEEAEDEPEEKQTKKKATLQKTTKTKKTNKTDKTDSDKEDEDGSGSDQQSDNDSDDEDDKKAEQEKLADEQDKVQEGIEDAKDALRGVQYNEEDFKKYLEARRKIALNRLLSYLKYN